MKLYTYLYRLGFAVRVLLELGTKLLTSSLSTASLTPTYNLTFFLFRVVEVVVNPSVLIILPNLLRLAKIPFSPQS